MLATTSQSSELLEKFAAVLGTEGLLTSLEDRETFSGDLYAQGVTCLAVVRPDTVEQLSKVVALATESGCAIYPRGGGMSYVEGYNPQVDQSIVVDTSRLNRIIEISPDDMYITVECGVTWKQIYDALAPMGLRLPYYGTFSGAVSTVGGGLSQGASFFGSARYGTAAEIVLALEVCLADGTLVRTSQSALPGAKPVFRGYGPDLTGLFVHDCGILGIKTRATFRLIRMPEAVDFLCFGFTEAADAIAALSEIARAEVAEDACVLDPVKTKGALAAGGLSNDLKVLAAVATKSGGLLKGLRSTANIALAGRNFANGFYSLNMSIVRANPEALKADMALATEIARKYNGVLLPDSIPRATRFYLFPAPNGVVGPAGERWTAVNAKLAHSEAPRLDEAVRSLLAAAKADLDANGVEATQMFSVAQNHVFSYEVSFTWKDDWLKLQRETADAGYLRKLGEPAPNPSGRELVARLRAEIVKLFAEFGAGSNQLGRAYPYASVLEPTTRALLQSIKAAVDPRGLMNPGALEF